MATNARIERLTREALGVPGNPVSFPTGTLKALCVLATGLAAISALAGTFAARDLSTTRASHTFIGTVPAAVDQAATEGPVQDLTY